MSRLYNRTFKIGFVLAIGTFAALNIFAYILAQQQYKKLLNSPIQLAPATGVPAWGVPFKWEGYNLSHTRYGTFSDLFSVADGLILNFLAITACGFLLGFIVRWLSRNYK